MSFAAASFLYNEYRDTHKLVAWSGYALATTTGLMRVMNDEHWMSDIIFGAGLAILCNELVYMHHNRIRKNKNNSSLLMITPQVSTARIGFSLDYKF
jgi:membrane-associated phospholipid phosphatase